MFGEEPPSAAKRSRTGAESGPPPTPLSAKHRRNAYGSSSSRSTPTPHKLEEFAGGQAYCSPEEATVKFQQVVDDPDAITDSVGEDTRARKRCWVNPQNRVTKRRICYPPQAGNGDAAATAAPAHQAVAQRERPSLGQGVLIDYARAGALRLQRSWMRRQVHAAQMLVEAETDQNQQCAKDPDIAEEVRHERKIFNLRVRLLKLGWLLG